MNTSRKNRTAETATATATETTPIETGETTTPIETGETVETGETGETAGQDGETATETETADPLAGFVVVTANIKGARVNKEGKVATVAAITFAPKNEANPKGTNRGTLNVPGRELLEAMGKTVGDGTKNPHVALAFNPTTQQIAIIPNHPQAAVLLGTDSSGKGSLLNCRTFLMANPAVAGRYELAQVGELLIGTKVAQG